MLLDEGAEVAGSQRKFLSLVKPLRLQDRIRALSVWQTANCSLCPVPGTKGVSLQPGHHILCISCSAAFPFGIKAIYSLL